MKELIKSVLGIIVMMVLFYAAIGAMLGLETPCRIVGMGGIGTVPANCLKYFVN